MMRKLLMSQAAILLAIGASAVTGSILSCPDTLDKSHEIDSRATLFYAIVPSDPPGSRNGILCGRLEAEHEGWVSLGFSNDGQMAGSDAIIGLAGSEDNKTSVRKYDLTYAATEMSADKQTLRDTRYIIEDGKIIMAFTKLLVEEGEVPISEDGKNILLYARGGDTLGWHGIDGRMSFELDFGSADVDVKVGDEVCITNYIMDQFCINLGHLLDNKDIRTLEHPEEHSYHCLLDVPVCRNSGYVVLTDKDETTGMHCLGYRLDDTEAIYQAGIAAGQEGKCKDCTGDTTKPVYGYRATVTGTVKELGDGTDGPGGTPLLENTKVLDASVECNSTIVKPVCMAPPVTEPSPTAVAQPVTYTGSQPTYPPTPVPQPVTDTAPSTKDCSKEMCEEKLSADYLLMYQLNVPKDTTLEKCDGCTISMELIYNGEAWVSIGFSTDGKMVGGEAVIGSASLAPQKYNLASYEIEGVQPMSEDQQTLINPSVEVKNGQTIMKFTKIMKEAGEIEISTTDNTFLWAHGTANFLSMHDEQGAFELNLSSGISEELIPLNKSVWLAHGIIAFLAWGVLIPFAVQASLLRDLLPKGPLWIKLHKVFNATAYASFIALFAIAVAYTSKEGKPHFNNDHQKMGLAMFIMASVQIIGGVVRPHQPAPGSDEEKTKVRKEWEVGHRVLGVALLACAFWQIDDGMKLYSRKYSVSESHEDKLSIAYWVWTGVMSAVIIVGGGYFKLRKKSSENTLNEASGGAKEEEVGPKEEEVEPKEEEVEPKEEEELPVAQVDGAP